MQSYDGKHITQEDIFIAVCFKKGYNAMTDFILASGSPRRKNFGAYGT